MKNITFATLSILFCGLCAETLADVGQWFAGKLLADTPVRLELSAAAALAPWRMMNASGMTEREDGSRDVLFSAEGAPRITGVYRMRDGECSIETSAGEPPAPQKSASLVVEAEWVFRPEADMRMQMFGLMGDLRMEDYGGGILLVDGTTVPLPKANNPEDVLRIGVANLSVMDADGGKRLDFAFHEPINLFVQYWGGKNMSLRFIIPPDDRATLLHKGGKERTLAFALSGAGPHRKSTLKPVKIEAGPDWIPFHADGEIAEGSALDFSAMRPTGKPCGKFGRLVVRGPHFEFEGLPGVPQRFYGVNLSHTANYPENLDDARGMAQALARVGYNSVRIHHHDGFCIDKSDPTVTRLDDEAMRRMDALVAACSEEGLYISTDLFVSRTRMPIAWRAVGVDRDGTLSMQDFKQSVYVNEGVYSNFLAFADNWLNHVNVFTGRRYAEEPALAWISLVNEGTVDGMSGNDFSSHPGWQEAWDEWNAKCKIENEKLWRGITSELPNGLARNRQGRAFLVFLQDVEARFVERTRRFLEDLGCRALVTDMNNGGLLSAAMQKVRAESFDYVDLHFYVDHPQFLEKNWARPSWCPNENPFKGAAMGAAAISAVRILDRPFAVSEYNFSGPGRYRGVGGIAAGAEAALQDWAGLWRFAWSHSIEAATHPGTRPLGYFDIASDPMQLASERASVCLFLRGDAAPLKTTYAVTLPPDKISSPDAMIGTSTRADWIGAAWRARIGNIVGAEPPSGAIHAGDFDEAFSKSAAEVMGEIEDCQKRQLSINDTNQNTNLCASVSPCENTAVAVTNGVFLINTPRTCGVFAEGGAHTAGVLKVTFLATKNAKVAKENLDLPFVDNGEHCEFVNNSSALPTTVWASSIDGKPLAQSRRILVTHLTDVQNSGASYADADMTVLKDFGRLPYLMRSGTAEVELNLDVDIGNNPFRVWALAADGKRECQVPCAFDQATGRLRFTASVRQPFGGCMLYEIVRK